MDAKINAKKVIGKRDRNRVLGGLSYLAGFPLLILIAFIFSVPLMKATGFGATKYYGVLACVAAWIVLTFVQIVMALVTKNCTARAAVVIIITLIVMIGAPVYFDIWAEKQVNVARDAYVREVCGLSDEVELTHLKNHSNKDIVTFTDDSYVRKTYRIDEKIEIDYYVDSYGVNHVTYEKGKNKYDYAIAFNCDIGTYAYQVNHYVTWTKKGTVTEQVSGMFDEFARVYNVGYGAEVKGAINTDGSKYGKALERENEEGDTYSEYWFGEKGNVYKENGLYADGYIFSIPVANEILITYYETQAKYAGATGGADGLYKKYLASARSSAEYKEYTRSEEYIEEIKKLDSFMITSDRLSDIIGALGQEIVDKGVLKKLPSVLTFNLSDMVADFLAENDITESQLKNLNLANTIALVKSFAPALGVDESQISEEWIMSLLGDFSNYQVSSIKPDFYFIDDSTEEGKDMRNYAYALYFGKTHGANIGSVLIPSTEGGKIGKITMNDSGLSYEENAFGLNECYKLRAYNSYAPKLFPLFVARRYFYIFAGIIALMYAIFYYSQMKVKLLGKKLEKMSTLGGVR